MTPTVVALSADRRQPLAWRDWARSTQRPGAVRRIHLVAAGGGLVLLGHAAAQAAGVHLGPMAAMHDGGRGHGAAGPTWPGLIGLAAIEVALWAAMVSATMLPLLAPNLAFVEQRTPRRNRGAVTAAMVAGWASVWGVGCLVLGAAASLLVHDLGYPAAIAVAFGAAIAWQFTEQKRESLVRCHRTCIPPMQRRRGTAVAHRFGRGLALDCVMTCGPMMLAMAVTGHALAVVVPLGWVAWAERRRPHHLPRPVVGAEVIGVVGLLAFLAAVAT